MNVALSEHLTFVCEVLDMAVVTNVTPLSLLILWELSFQIVSLKMSSLPTLALKFPNKIFV
jgi:hypothetical protein